MPIVVRWTSERERHNSFTLHDSTKNSTRNLFFHIENTSHADEIVFHNDNRIAI